MARLYRPLLALICGCNSYNILSPSLDFVAIILSTLKLFSSLYNHYSLLNQMAMIRIPYFSIHPKLWRFLGFFSSLVGLLCYALSSSFRHLFGEWNFLKIIIYVVVSSIISCMMLFAKKWKLSRSFLLKVHLSFVILMLTTLYSFFYDKSMKGNPDTLSLISCAAFAVMSLSLSRQIDLGFEVDLLNFFLGCLTVQLMKISLFLGFTAAIFCYFLIVLRSNSPLQIGAIREEDHVEVEIDTVRGGDNRISNQLRHQQMQTLSRRRLFDDGYHWKKYEEKQVRGSEKHGSYYKCTMPNCPVKKRVERSIDGQVSEVLYKGTHNHCKRELPMMRNLSFESLHPHDETPYQSLDSQGYEQLDSDDTPENSSMSI